MRQIKIALVSFEYPPKTAVGGIGTYMYQTAQMLMRHKIYVEVFTSTIGEMDESSIEDGILIHRLSTTNHDFFRKEISRLFKERNSKIHFSCIEGPEYGADTYYIKKSFPEIPLHIKLHTPSFLIRDITGKKLTIFQKTRFILGALRKLEKPIAYWQYKYTTDLEYLNLIEATFITSPSGDLIKQVRRRWKIDKPIYLLPSSYTPRSELLEISTNDLPDKPIITYIGRLEIRKGVHNFSEIVPKVASVYPNAIFRFIGRDFPSPNKGISMKSYLSSSLSDFIENIEFIGEISQRELPKFLANTSICVFPSLWENFPNVCLESMSAARCVIGGKNGGMSEMLANDCGILVNPKNLNEIAETIIKTLKQPEIIIQRGINARDKILNSYNEEIIIKHYINLLINNLKSE